MRVGIHQSNLFPRRAWFSKLAACDVFVLLGYCQFEKGKYQNRFHIGPDWFTLSVEHGMKPIREKRYANPAYDWERIKSRLTQYPVLAEFDGYIGRSLWNTNKQIIYDLAFRLGIKTVIAEDHPTSLTGTDRLVDLCQRHGATSYLAGASGAHYMDLSLFEKAGIKVDFQDAETADTRPILECL